MDRVGTCGHCGSGVNVVEGDAGHQRGVIVDRIDEGDGRQTVASHIVCPHPHRGRNRSAIHRACHGDIGGKGGWNRPEPE